MKYDHGLRTGSLGGTYPDPPGVMGPLKVPLGQRLQDQNRDTGKSSAEGAKGSESHEDGSTGHGGWTVRGRVRS